MWYKATSWLLYNSLSTYFKYTCTCNIDVISLILTKLWNIYFFSYFVLAVHKKYTCGNFSAGIQLANNITKTMTTSQDMKNYNFIKISVMCVCVCVWVLFIYLNLNLLTLLYSVMLVKTTQINLPYFFLFLCKFMGVWL